MISVAVCMFLCIANVFCLFFLLLMALFKRLLFTGLLLGIHLISLIMNFLLLQPLSLLEPLLLSTRIWLFVLQDQSACSVTLEMHSVHSVGIAQTTYGAATLVILRLTMTPTSPQSESLQSWPLTGLTCSVQMRSSL